MWELDYKEGWVPKNWCFWTVVLEKTLERPLDCKEIQPVHPKGNQSWIFIGRTHSEAETPILWPPDVKNWLTGKDPDAGKDWRQEEKGMTEDEMVGWHHWLDGHGFGWTLGLGDGQGGLACCGSWGRKESDTTEWLNWTEALFHSELWFYFTKCMKTFFLFLTNFPKSNSKWSVVCFCFLLQTNFEIPQRALEYFKRFVLSPYKKENVTGVRLIWYVKLHGFVLIIKLFPTLLQPHGL